VSKQRILVVEPDATLLHNVATNILSPQNYKSITAQTFAEGLTSAKAEPPDLILLRLLRDETTHFLQSLVKSIGRTIPTILIIDHSSAQIETQLLRLGVRDYVTWPLLAEDLLQAIQRVSAPPHQGEASLPTNSRYANLEFADMASHLMRNPLNVIQTSVRCLQTLNLNKQEEKNLLEKIWNQSQSLAKFTNELLKILRFEVEGAEICKTPVALEPLVEKVVKTLQTETPKINYSVKTDVSNGDVPPVAADSTKTELVLFNLLVGATRRCRKGGQVAVRLSVDASEITITIKDNGKPIPLQSLDDIFQPYYSINHSRLNVPASYQLGLFTTKKLVELQNGRIWANNLTNDAGSEFHFSLPLWEKGS